MLRVSMHVFLNLYFMYVLKIKDKLSGNHGSLSSELAQQILVSESYKSLLELFFFNSFEYTFVAVSFQKGAERKRNFGLHEKRPPLLRPRSGSAPSIDPHHLNGIRWIKKVTQ